MIQNVGQCHNGENGVSTVATNLGRILDESQRSSDVPRTLLGRNSHGMVTGWSRDDHGHVTKTKDSLYYRFRIINLNYRLFL